MAAFFLMQLINRLMILPCCRCSRTVQASEPPPASQLSVSPAVLAQLPASQPLVRPAASGLQRRSQRLDSPARLAQLQLRCSLLLGSLQALALPPASQGLDSHLGLARLPASRPLGKPAPLAQRPPPASQRLVRPAALGSPQDSGLPPASQHSASLLALGRQRSKVVGLARLASRSSRLPLAPLLARLGE
jgi:hypothetical protein